jgi:electron transfer flavoprotein beta subunit
VRIYVCVKHVPDTGAYIALTGKTSYDESVKFVINPFDEYGVEQAVRTVEQRGEGEVVIVTVGKDAAEAAIRSALALGAHRGILVRTGQAFLDSGQTSRALQKAIEMDGRPDLVLMGRQAADVEGMQTPYRLAAALGMPVATNVVSIDMRKDRAIVEREMEDGSREVMEMTMPCVVGTTKGINEPRSPRLVEMIKAKNKEIRRIDITDLSVEDSATGAELVELTRPPERSQAVMLQGDPQEMAVELVRRLRQSRVL